jgi:pimeloyl-ACP methyl ester carboxylesterase
MGTAALAYPDPPKVRHSLLEMVRVFYELGSGLALGPLLRTLPRGDGHSVMTLPGFFAGDSSTASLRNFLERQGYCGLPWGEGRNIPDEGLTNMEETLEYRRRIERTIAHKLRAEKKRSGGKVSLVGWSLGGLYATGIAHRYPDLVRQVITLGTPFGDPRATSIYAAMERVYKADVSAVMLRQWSDFTFEGDLQVPVTALYSYSDGFVGVDIARIPEHPLVDNIAVMASHVGFPFNPLVRALLAERLAQAEDDWQPYDKVLLRPFIHKPH